MSIPALYVSFHKHNVCFRVSFHGFFRGADGRCVRHSLITQQIIPVISSELGTTFMVFRLESADPFGAIVDVVKWFVSMKGGLDNQEIPIQLALLLPVRRSRPLQGFARVKLVCLIEQKGGQGSDVLIVRVLRIATYKIFTKTMRGSLV